MSYKSIFDAVPWESIGISILQSFSLYWLLMLGLKIVGKRVFGELGPQDLVLLLVISEATDLGLTHQDAGYWGTVASVITILVTGWSVERISPLRRLLEDQAIEVLKDGKPLREVMKKNMVHDEDLIKVARQYGVASLEPFQSMVLEGDGSITGVFWPEYFELRGKVN